MNKKILLLLLAVLVSLNAKSETTKTVEKLVFSHHFSQVGPYGATFHRFVDGNKTYWKIIFTPNPNDSRA